jgi:hypothetical protein
MFMSMFPTDPPRPTAKEKSFRERGVIVNSLQRGGGAKSRRHHRDRAQAYAAGGEGSYRAGPGQARCACPQDTLFPRPQSRQIYAIVW